MERIVKGIWIPIEIWEAQDLSWNEKILLMEIDSFTAKGKDCFISDEYIAQLLNVGLTYANKLLSSLIKKGYVVKTRFDGRRRYIESRADLHENATQTWQEVQPTYNNIPISEDKSSSICNKGFDFKKSLIALGVSQQIASDWVSVRKGKKATNTETAFKSIEREILKSGRSAEECITIAVENSWSGFKAEWLLNQQQRQTPPSGKKSVLQNNMEVAEQLMRMANIGEYE
jgi:DNA-binding MarR family transcriptional regulator